MCLLVMMSRPGAAEALVVAANRDERADRAAVALTVLQEAGPRIVGGRDLLAGGTWLSVNEHGVVAGLTNTPTAEGRDPTKRSRGFLPLLAARQLTARDAAETLVAEVAPAEFNPGWLLIGDRREVLAVTIDGDRPTITPRGRGTHVLENRPPGDRSAKVRHVEGQLTAFPADESGGDLRRRLREILADHRPAPGPDPAGDERRLRRPELLAACVHAPGHGTRSSALIVVPGDEGALPEVWVADGPPCRVPFADRSDCWD